MLKSVVVFIVSLKLVATIFDSTEPGHCRGRCNSSYDRSLPCQCNAKCPQYQNCCPDFNSACLGGGSVSSGGSCSGRCGSRYDQSKTCQCNSDCTYHHDCCTDYNAVCAKGSGSQSPDHTSSGTGSHTLVDLSKLADQLWAVDPDKVNITDIHLNIGGHKTTSSQTDVSTSQLFTSVNTNVFSRPLYFALFTLYGNYNPVLGESDLLSKDDHAEIVHFLDIAMQSPVMEATYNFVITNKLFTGDQAAFRAKIFDLWFNPYPRSHESIKDSSAFEHVFVGETRGKKVEGFHNWVRYYREQQAGNINYYGYMKRNGPQMLEFSFTWNGDYKAIDSFIIGSSPVFDIALGTVCFLRHPSAQCPYSLNGYKFSIQQYDDSPAPGLQIATAYTIF